MMTRLLQTQLFTIVLAASVAFGASPSLSLGSTQSGESDVINRVLALDQELRDILSRRIDAGDEAMLARQRKLFDETLTQYNALQAGMQKNLGPETARVQGALQQLEADIRAMLNEAQSFTDTDLLAEHQVRFNEKLTELNRLKDRLTGLIKLSTHDKVIQSELKPSESSIINFEQLKSMGLKTDPYEILGLPNTAANEDVLERYRQLTEELSSNSKFVKKLISGHPEQRSQLEALLKNARMQIYIAHEEISSNPDTISGEEFAHIAKEVQACGTLPCETGEPGMASLFLDRADLRTFKKRIAPLNEMLQTEDGDKAFKQMVRASAAKYSRDFQELELAVTDEDFASAVSGLAAKRLRREEVPSGPKQFTQEVIDFQQRQRSRFSELQGALMTNERKADLSKKVEKYLVDFENLISQIPKLDNRGLVKSRTYEYRDALVKVYLYAEALSRSDRLPRDQQQTLQKALNSTLKDWMARTSGILSFGRKIRLDQAAMGPLSDLIKNYSPLVSQEVRSTVANLHISDLIYARTYDGEMLARLARQGLLRRLTGLFGFHYLSGVVGGSIAGAYAGFSPGQTFLMSQLGGGLFALSNTLTADGAEARALIRAHRDVKKTNAAINCLVNNIDADLNRR